MGTSVNPQTQDFLVVLYHEKYEMSPPYEYAAHSVAVLQLVRALLCTRV
jgi:hypothetical protein